MAPVFLVSLRSAGSAAPVLPHRAVCGGLRSGPACSHHRGRTGSVGLGTAPNDSSPSRCRTIWKRSELIRVDGWFRRSTICRRCWKRRPANRHFRPRSGGSPARSRARGGTSIPSVPSLRTAPDHRRSASAPGGRRQTSAWAQVTVPMAAAGAGLRSPGPASARASNRRLSTVRCDVLIATNKRRGREWRWSRFGRRFLCVCGGVSPVLSRPLARWRFESESVLRPEWLFWPGSPFPSLSLSRSNRPQTLLQSLAPPSRTLADPGRVASGSGSKRPARPAPERSLRLHDRDYSSTVLYAAIRKMRRRSHRDRRIGRESGQCLPIEGCGRPRSTDTAARPR